MTEKEKAIQNYMKSLDISREEAEQLYLDDIEDYIGEEGEAMEAAAKKVQHREKAAAPRKNNKPKERKIDLEKKSLFDMVKNFLAGQTSISDVLTKTETEISFNYNDSHYTWKLTKHRPPKK